ncbi:hypothetical protein BdWA1_002619 [Babesia duncani]|uniref:Uncharacterized protein n=1 Tax=Babesia duncani TaxID=323732 RepID=A0AAD9UMK8_9APIC|nr:hypothetical protein BdWA1_003684 [Babesia duncani]KAK2194844.1 hypothetical protein BdWA1_003685 [Babesia duncani]KAK2194845.1 hypothetical protein BdWA1_003686 [Babesia duncani]KAK2196019.1 hypothetical protein BdWA1_002617 [Babesia duncani]KAK2196020.1 hypothetical protein BdWA1_002618 [Babesia duncani]
MAGLTAIVMNKINYDNVIVTCNRQHASTLCVHTPIRDEDYFNNVRAYRWPVNVIGGINQKDISVFHISMSILYFKLLNHSWSSRNPERGEKYYYFELKGGCLTYNAISKYVEASGIFFRPTAMADLSDDVHYDFITEEKLAPNITNYVIHDYITVNKIKCSGVDVWKSKLMNTTRVTRISRFEKYGNVFLDLLFRTRNDVELLVSYIMKSNTWICLDPREGTTCSGYFEEPVAGTSRGRQSRRAHPYSNLNVFGTAGGKPKSYLQPICITLDVKVDIQSTSIIKVDAYSYNDNNFYTYLSHVNVNVNEAYCDGVQIFKELEYPPFLLIYNAHNLMVVDTLALKDEDIILKSYIYNTISSTWIEDSSPGFGNDIYTFELDTETKVDHRLYTKNNIIVNNIITDVYTARRFIGFSIVIFNDSISSCSRFLQGNTIKKVLLQENLRRYIYIHEGIEFVVEDTRLPSGEWNEGTLPGEIYLGNV